MVLYLYIVVTYQVATPIMAPDTPLTETLHFWDTLKASDGQVPRCAESRFSKECPNTNPRGVTPDISEKEMNKIIR